ncbi:uncharacterized protein LOC114266798 [Camellia sinensis]|uniref:uncharacterized protein LOC114266798 n=1 Tax=Camellia sinensis TaxID=4442 RepID=UPI001035DB42|nr:uncharacterized protein LOC114266798 [Camellia sinensis]
MASRLAPMQAPPPVAVPNPVPNPFPEVRAPIQVPSVVSQANGTDAGSATQEQTGPFQPTHFVTLVDIQAMLEQERSKKQLLSLPNPDVKSPYSQEILTMPYPIGYTMPKFIKFNRKQGNTREHVVRFIETLGVYGSDHSLRLREFSKSLTERAYSWYVNLAPNSIKSWEEMVNKFHTKFFQVQEKVITLTLGRDIQKEGEDILDYVSALVEAARNLNTTGPLHRSRGSHRYPHSNKIAAVTSTGGSRSQMEALSSRKRKSYMDRNPYPCSLENVKTLVKEWIANGELTLSPVYVPPTKEDKESPDYCIYHRATRHPMRDCWTLKGIFKKKVTANELKFKDADNCDVRKDPYLNHKEKGKNVHMIGYLGPMRNQVHMVSYYDELEEIATSQLPKIVPTDSQRILMLRPCKTLLSFAPF